MTKVFLLFLLITCTNALAQKIVYEDKILAKVNGKVITSFDLEEMTIRIQQRIKEIYSPEIAAKRISELKSSSLQQLIDDIIILDEFKAKQANFPEALVDNKLEQEIKSKANGDRSVFITMLDRGGVSLEEYRDQIRDSIAVQLMIRENVRRKINVTPVDITRYYKDNTSDFLTDAEIRGAVISVLKAKKSDSEFNEKVQSVKDALQKEDFAKVADRLSELPGKPKGGDLGFKKPEELNSVFKSALSSLSKGEVSDPVELDGNVFFFKLIDKRGGSALPLLKVRERIKNKLEDNQERKYYKEYIAALRKKASVEDFTKK